MVILYNKTTPKFTETLTKKYKSKQKQKLFSNRTNSQRLTPKNRKFLISLGYKLK